jgi:hypothetical protein
VFAKAQGGSPVLGFVGALSPAAAAPRSVGFARFSTQTDGPLNNGSDKTKHMKTPKKLTQKQWTAALLVTYVLLGFSALLILIEMIESGTLRTLLPAFILIGVAITKIATLQAAGRQSAEPGAAPSGGPAKPGADSGVTHGPPSES